MRSFNTNHAALYDEIARQDQPPGNVIKSSMDGGRGE
jgi:hypothetical protein